MDISISPDLRFSLCLFISDVTASKSSSLHSAPLLQESKWECDFIRTRMMFCSVADILSKFAGMLKLALLLLVKLLIVFFNVLIADQSLHIEVLV